MMIDLGIATSVAKKQNYSWQVATNIAKYHNFRTIQYYFPENGIIPQVDNFSYFNKIYFHLPDSTHLFESKYLEVAKHFRDKFPAIKMILHQKEDWTHERTLDLIKQYTETGFDAGMENEGKSDLYSYLELIKFLSMEKLKIFVVIDLHRFYYNFYEEYNSELILDMVFRLFDFCAKSELKIVLHLIDSKSYRSDRRYWTPIMNGILPLREIFKYIFGNQINIETIILEYESDEYLKKSIYNLNREIMYFERNKVN